jgi:hypothetical protein
MDSSGRGNRYKSPPNAATFIKGKNTMSDVFASTLFVFAVYCAWAIAVYKKPQTVTATEPEAQPIDYFPEVDDDDFVPTPEIEQPAEWEKEFEPQPVISIVERRPVAAMTVPQTKSPTDLAGLGVRDLYKIASQQGIKGYKKLSKNQLLDLLQ